MVILTRKHLEKLTKEELINELLTVNSINEDLANLTWGLDEFLEKYEWVESELAVWKKLHETSLHTNRNTTKKYFRLCNTLGEKW